MTMEEEITKILVDAMGVWSVPGRVFERMTHNLADYICQLLEEQEGKFYYRAYDEGYADALEYAQSEES